MRSSSSPLMAWVVLACVAIFAALYGVAVHREFSGQHLTFAGALIIIFTAVVEVTASFYAFASVFSAFTYLFMRFSGTRHPGEDPASPPAVGILYLCCGDLDAAALSSLCGLRYRGSVHLVIHDDSESREQQRRVDHAVAGLPLPSNYTVKLLRRPEKSGGKPGAVNYVLQETGHSYGYFLLCDNDSTVVDPDAIEKAIPHFRDPRIAIVQCRSVAVEGDDDGPMQRLLARSIEVFDLFLSVCAHFGWSLFIGHNALLRTEAVLDAGGLTPGFFADDLDLTVRLKLRGYSVVYERDAPIGEKHPASYGSFRRRTYKWAYGCMQMLKAHGRTVLTSRRFSFAEKVSFFYFTGFYVGQVTLLFYIGITFLVAPFYLNSRWSDVPLSMLVGALLVILIYLPICSYFIRHGELRRSLASVVMCGLVYGTTDFVCAAGVWDCLRGRKRRWVPTNAPGEGTESRAVLREAAFGALLLLVPLVRFPALLYVPCSYLFAGKFLLAPTVSQFYRERRDSEEAPAVAEAALS